MAHDMTSAVRTPGVPLAAALLAALVLAGCQARLTIDITVARDGSGTLTVSLAADDELLEQAGAAGADPLADLAATGRSLEADGWRVTETVHDDGSRTVVLATDFEEPPAFNELAVTLAEALAAPEATLVERLVLEVDEDLVRLDGTVGAVPGPAVAELGLGPAEAVGLLAEHDAFSFDVLVTLPGEVLETNADGTAQPLRWEVAPGERVELHAVAERPPSVGWWLAAAALVLAGSSAWALRRRA